MIQVPGLFYKKRPFWFDLLACEERGREKGERKGDSLEFLFVEKRFGLGLAFLVAGVIVALFPSNYEIKGMDESSDDKQ